MNIFIEKLVKQFKRISSDGDIGRTYSWLFQNQKEISKTTSQINQQLALIGDYILQADMPTFTIGSRKGTLLLAFNPGWKEEDNKKEDSACRQSEKEYVNFMFNFFHQYPQKVGKRAKWWTRAIGFHLLQSGFDPNGITTEEKWNLAHLQKPTPIGGWNLIPFHSKADGLSKKIFEVAWLKKLAQSSLLAAIRCNPKQLIVASKEGYDLVRYNLLSNLNWVDTKVERNNKYKTKVSISLTYKKTTEIIAMQAQHFSQGVILPNQEMMIVIAKLRQNYNNST